MKTQAIFNCFVGARGAAAGGYAVSIGRDCLVGREDLWDSGAAAGGFRSGFRLWSESFSRGGHVRAFTYNYVKTRTKHPAPHDLLSSGCNKVCFATTPPDMEASCIKKQQNGYTFSAKEKDDETQYSYFGARYYDSDLSVWLSVDPMSDKYPHQSPYMYCSGNPVMRIDPNGMWDIGYTVDDNGVLTQVDNTGGNKFDVIYNKADYEAGKRDYDESGTKSGMKINRGEVSNFQSIPIKNLDGVQTGSLSNCEVKTEDVADKLFKFLADNTTVEWQNSNFTSPDGKSVNVIATSREGGEKGGTISGGRELDESYMKKGYTLNKSTHSHPYNYYLGWKVSGFYGNTSGYGEGDLGAKQILQNFETKSRTRPGANAKFFMYWRGNFYPY